MAKTIDWLSLPGGPDLSHHNGVIDWDAVAAARPAFVALKATERRWTDPMFDRNREAAERHGIAVLPYVFLRPDDDEQTIRYFADVVGSIGLPVALDWEAPDVPAAIVETWIDGCEAELRRTPIAYYGMFPPAPPTVKIGRCPRWYPQYPKSAAAPPRLMMWQQEPEPDWRKSWLIWQWTEAGGFPGIKGKVDLNRLACSAVEFVDWYKTGALPASAATQPEPTMPGIAMQPIGVAIAEHRRANRVLQGALKAGGYDPGPVDGIWGDHSQDALAAHLKTQR